MTKAEFIKILKKQAGFSTLGQAKAAYESLFAIIGAALQIQSGKIVGEALFPFPQGRSNTGRPVLYLKLPLWQSRYCLVPSMKNVD